MDLQITKYQFGERPQVSKPDHLFYLAMGENGMREMVNNHYDLLRKSSINHLFPVDNELFEAAKRNSADFMIQICGGPEYFNQHRGNPMLSKRHAPFAITAEGRIVWLECYKQVLIHLDIAENLVLSFWNYLNVFSNWVVNTKSDEDSFPIIIPE